jgi:cell division protein FtsB
VKRRTILAVVLLLASLLVFNSCASEVSQEEYQALVADLDAAQAKIANLEAQIADINTQQEEQIAQLNAQIETLTSERDAAQTEIANLEAQVQDLSAQVEALTSTAPIEEAWERAKERHTSVMSGIPFLDDLLDLAPWVEFPDKPAWFDSAQICSATLADKAEGYEGACLVKSPGQQMLISVYEADEVVSMFCLGGSLDYEMTIILDDTGNIIEEFFSAGDTHCSITWSEEGGEEFFSANMNGEVFQVLWSEDIDDLATFCADFTGWLQSIDKAGGLILPSDQDLIILGLGELKGALPPPVPLSIKGEIIKRAVSDICCGVPQTCLL